MIKNIINSLKERDDTRINEATESIAQSKNEDKTFHYVCSFWGSPDFFNADGTRLMNNKDQKISIGDKVEIISDSTKKGLRGIVRKIKQRPPQRDKYHIYLGPKKDRLDAYLTVCNLEEIKKVS